MGSKVIRPVGQTFYYVDANNTVQDMRYGSVHRNTLMLVDEEARARELRNIIAAELKGADANKIQRLVILYGSAMGFRPYFGIDFC